MAVHCEENVLQYRKENIKGGPIVQKSNAIFSAVPMCPKCATRGLTYVSRNCQHPGGERHRRQGNGLQNECRWRTDIQLYTISLCNCVYITALLHI